MIFSISDTITQAARERKVLRIIYGEKDGTSEGWRYVEPYSFSATTDTDGIKKTNSDIAARLYELREKVESRLSSRESDYDSDGSVSGEYPPYAPEDEKIYNSTYQLIEELDAELKKLNESIDALQKNLSIPVKRRKCDFDVEIARDVFNMSGSFEHLILFSGDGDYAALVEDLIAKGKKVIVVFAPGHKGKEYEDFKQGVFLCSVNQLRDVLFKETNIPADFSAGRDGSILSRDKVKSQ